VVVPSPLALVLISQTDQVDSASSEPGWPGCGPVAARFTKL